MTFDDVGAAAFSGAGSALRDRVSVRAREIALLAGRPPPHVAQADYEQAKQELTGESDRDLQNAVLDSPS